MTFIIENIILWPEDEKKEIRTISFEAGKINVITGESHKGKSSLIHIIDYCLASGKCTIPVGVIREKTEWFGLKIQTDNEQIILARKNPGDQDQTSKMYIKEGNEVGIPHRPHKNTNTGNVKNLLNQIAGFSKFDFEDETGTGRLNQRASFRDTSAFQFQPQHIIANPYTLYYKADTYEHQEKLKTIFPLVLGAIDNDYLLLNKRLSDLQNDLSKKNEKIRLKQKAKDEWLSEIKGLFWKAKQYGLFDNDVPDETEDFDTEDYLIYLNQLNQKSNEALVPEYQEGTAKKVSSKFNRLIEEEREIASDILSHKVQLQNIKEFSDTTNDYSESLKTEESKLEPVGWFNERLENNKCPFCGSENEKSNKQISQLQDKYKELTQKTDSIKSKDLSLSKEIRDIEKTITKLEKQKSDLRNEIEELAFTNEEDQKTATDLKDTQRFLGRLEQALENVNSIAIDSELLSEVDVLEDKISTIKEKLNEASKKNKLDKIKNKIGKLITHYSSFLDIDNPYSPVEIDIKNLTLKIIIGSRQNYLWEIGSGANWMGYHLATFLAFHEHFLSLDKSSVPTFLFLDQPTQVYFPEEWPEEDEIQDQKDDKHSDFYQARKIFKALSKSIERTKGEFQLIVTDHAPELTWDGIDHINFVADWRGDQALIPESWLND